MFELSEGLELKRPDVVFYHADCPDGFGAAWALQKFFPEAAGTRYLPLAYGAAVPPEFDGKRLLFVDVSLPRPAFTSLSARAEVFLLDHHASSAQELGDLPNTYFDLSRSGAGLAWDVASAGAARPLLVDLLEDRDLHAMRLVDTELLRALDSLPMTFDQWDGFSHSLEQDRPRIEAEATAIARYEVRLAERVAQHAVPVVQQGANGWAVNAPAPLADAVSKILLSRPGADFSLTWFFDGALRRPSCSWRTCPGAPVLAVDLARAHGGGGHPHAAGARLSRETMRELLDSRLPPALPRRSAAIRPSTPVA